MIKTAVLILVLAAGACPGAFAASPEETRSEQAAIMWLAHSAHTFSDAAPVEGELEPLAAKLARARVVGIGESTHGSHEDFAFKIELIKTLVRRGQIDTVAIEANRSPVAVLNGYVTEGQGDPVAALTGPGMFRTYQTEEFLGLVTWLRAWNRTAPRAVRMVGIDVQDSSVDLDSALAFVETDKAERAIAADLRRRLAPLVTLTGAGVRLYDFTAKATPEDWRRAYGASTSLEALFTANAQEWSARPGYREARYAAKTGRQGLAVFEYDVRHVKFEDQPHDVQSRRDVFMADDLIDLLGVDGRAVLWAHDAHVMRSGPANFADYTTVGRELSKTLGANYAVVGFAWSTGSFNAIPMTAFALGGATPPIQPLVARNDLPGDIGGPLTRVGMPRFWVDLADFPANDWSRQWLTQPYQRGWVGATFDPKSWQIDPNDMSPLRPGIDVLVYFQKITPSRMLPRPSQK